MNSPIMPGHQVKALECHDEVDDDNRNANETEMYGKLQARCTSFLSRSGATRQQKQIAVWELMPISCAEGGNDPNKKPRVPGRVFASERN
jgi:hypothetical protein